MSMERVVSFDPQKVWIEEVNGVKCVVKKTNQLEVEMVQLVKRHLTLNNASSFFWGGTVFKVNIPDILSWDPDKKIMHQQYCKGNNVELLLRSMFGEERHRIVSFLLDFMEWMRKNGMFWEGAAPRHLIVEELGKNLSLVDFERPIILQEYSFSEEEFRVLLRGTVHEEFCAFLFEDEQKMLFANIWDDVSQGEVPTSSIRSVRQLILYEKFFGRPKGKVFMKQLALVQRFMSGIVTPFLLDNSPFFPLVALDKIRGAQNYVETILELDRTKRVEWPLVFARRAGVAGI